jgi:hypothetical protein
MALLKTKCLVVHVVANASEIDANFATIVLVALKQFIDQGSSLLGKIDPIRRCLARFRLDYQIWLECFDKAMKHDFRRDLFLVSLAISRGHRFEKRDNEVEPTAPQHRIDLENVLKASLIPLFDEKGEAKWS